MLQLLRRPATATAAGFVLAIGVIAVLAPALAPYDPLTQDYARTLEGPSADHLLGTDYLGRDVLSRLVFGARVAAQASLQTVSIALLIGVPLGLIAGYRSGWWDRVMMRLLDVADAIPGLVLAFAVIAVLGTGLTNAMIAVSIIFSMNFMRLSRALALGERERLYVDAARTSGLTQRNILLRQILPNMAAPLIVQSTIFMGTALLIEAALSFLGLGLETGSASWGGMLSGSTRWQFQQPFLPWPPGLAITLTVLAFNVLGDGVRDVLAGGTRDRTPRRRPRVRARRAAAQPSLAQLPDDDVPLDVRGLSVAFPGEDGDVEVVSEVSIRVRRGEALGLVGESGSGKTMTGRAVLGILPAGGAVTAGSIHVDGAQIVGRDEAALNDVRGSRVAMVFQDPMVALSPVHTIGRQVGQAVRNHAPTLSRADVRRRCVELLEMVRIADPEARLGDYPHQFSGGMAQRIVIALALASNPSVLIADEPTTALDVTTQQEILDMLTDLKQRLGTAIVLITHDLGVVADACDRAAVMYAGQVVEEAAVDDLFAAPRHPYTRALLAAMPTGAGGDDRLPTIPGRVPPMTALAPGCRFAPRCAVRTDACDAAPVELGAGVRCLHAGAAWQAGDAAHERRSQVQ
ncbi:dipeptide/oligopeptide/nickel ABC transporter permease/ATP-binding protein [Nocardioides silvaticus]|uniref:dipeptide/oligopeptide/nickel ABC transporter permease/ATP-binding protein n=1 Tax=Nocardioides silvaticus TaxID=2201891 RepID=UPI0011B29837|nr:dipeptide/oligopeptide/nickel ABC transporter permease/ATP-binding protein [Nocardioides silvaticus]